MDWQNSFCLGSFYGSVHPLRQFALFALPPLPWPKTRRLWELQDRDKHTILINRIWVHYLVLPPSLTLKSSALSIQEGIPTVFKRRCSPNNLWLLPYQEKYACHSTPPPWDQTSLGNILVNPSLTIRQRRRLTGCLIMSTVLGDGWVMVEGLRACTGVITVIPMSMGCPESATTGKQIEWSPTGL